MMEHFNTDSVIRYVGESKQQVIDSRDVAKMIGKTHAHLMRDIDSYKEVLDQNPKLDSDRFFIESSYQAGTGKNYKCYLLTKQGCEFVHNIHLLSLGDEPIIQQKRRRLGNGTHFN